MEIRLKEQERSNLDLFCIKCSTIIFNKGERGKVSLITVEVLTSQM